MNGLPLGATSIDTQKSPDFSGLFFASVTDGLRDKCVAFRKFTEERVGLEVHAVPGFEFVLDDLAEVHVDDLAERLVLPRRARFTTVSDDHAAGVFALGAARTPRRGRE